MQEIQHEGRRGPAPAGAEAAEGIHQGPHRVELLRAGWAHPIATALFLATEEREHGGVKYCRVTLEDVRLSHVAVLHLLQGVSLRQLFDHVCCVNGSTLTVPCYLAFAVSPLLVEQPIILPRVILACAIFAPEGMKEEEVQQALFLDQVT